MYIYLGNENHVACSNLINLDELKVQIALGTITEDVLLDTVENENVSIDLLEYLDENGADLPSLRGMRFASMVSYALDQKRHASLIH